MSQMKKKTPTGQPRRALQAVPAAPTSEAIADLSARIAQSIIPKEKVDPKSQVVFAFRCDPMLRDQIHAAADARGLSATNFVIQVLKIATAPTK